MPLASLLPLLAYLIIGLVLRATLVLPGKPVETLLRLVFYVTLPALAFTAIAEAPLGRHAVFLPLLGFGIDAVCMACAFLYARGAGLSRQETVVVAIGAGITNMLFVFPFILAALGPEALVAAVLFDLGNAVFNATVVNLVAMRYGQRGAGSAADGLAGMLRTPLFIALVLAIGLNVAGGDIPGFLRQALQPLGAATVPLTLIALGLALDLGRLGDRLAAVTSALRMGVGFACGIVAVIVAGLDDATALVVLVAAAAPVGFSAVTFVSAAGADTGRAATAVSLSALAGFVLTSALLAWGRVHFGLVAPP